MTVLEFRILGPLDAVVDGRPLGLGGPRQRALLAILILRRGQAVPSDRLIDELWNERPPATAAKTLQGHVSHLRKLVGPDVLVTRNGGYLVDVAAEQVDADRFASLVADARAARDPAASRELLGRALGLWRGAPLSDLAYEPFAQGAIARLEEARLDALEDRLEADLALGRHRALIGELEGLVAAHPERERLLALLMLSLYRGGRQTEALEAYRRGRQALQEELGLEPGPELRALEQQILEHDPRLKARQAPASRARRRGLIATSVAVVLAAAVTAGLALRGHATAVRVQPNSLVAIDPATGKVVGDVLVGARPVGVAAAAGLLWVANLDDRTVSRVDPPTMRPLRLVPVGDPPTGIAAAGGRAWVVRSGATASSVTVAPIDPQFLRLGRTVRLHDLVPGGTGAIAARGRRLYVAPGYGLLTTLDTSGNILHQTDPNAAPTALAVAGDTVFITDSDAGNLTRIDATDARQAVFVRDDPSGIAAGFGAIWVAYAGENEVARIDPETLTVTRLIPVGAAPTGVAVGAGYVWVANSRDGTVTRIDPRGGPKRSIRVGGSPQAITVAYGRVWVTEDERTIPRVAGNGTLRFVYPHDVDTMDPAVSWDARASQLLYETCAKLLNYPDRAGPAGAEPVPEVAAALPTISADGRTYRFTIRPGFRFSTGAPVTARTFKATIERTLDPRVHSPSARELGGDIAGAQAYTAGRAAHLSGVTARGDQLTIRLAAPAGDFPARIAQPPFCAVPPNTPHVPQTSPIPMAGPYQIAHYVPKQGVVLTRNPHYPGTRLRRSARIEFVPGMSPDRAIARVKHGTADFTPSTPSPEEDRRLRARYAATRYRVVAQPQLDLFALNTHRPLFADARTRQAVNYAIDRSKLDALGDGYVPLPEHETDHYIPPGLPGYRDAQVYPPHPDLAKARQLATPRARNTLVLLVCQEPPCAQEAAIVRTDLRRIGLRVRIEAPPDAVLGTRQRQGAGWDMAWLGWIRDYPDPSAMLNELLSSDTVLPRLADPGFQARLAAADRLTGARRYLAYEQLDADLKRYAAPLVAFGNLSSREFLSARVGCAFDSVYGIDLGALCAR